MRWPKETLSAPFVGCDWYRPAIHLRAKIPGQADEFLLLLAVVQQNSGHTCMGARHLSNIANPAGREALVRISREASLCSPTSPRRIDETAHTTSRNTPPIEGAWSWDKRKSRASRTGCSYSASGWTREVRHAPGRERSRSLVQAGSLTSGSRCPACRVPARSSMRN